MQGGEMATLPRGPNASMLHLDRVTNLTVESLRVIEPE